MEKESTKSFTTFELNAVETNRLRKFVSFHRKHAIHCATGELVRVSFVVTTLGTISEVQCLTCGKVEELTDYDEWNL